MDAVLSFLKENKDAFSSLSSIFALLIFGFAVLQYRRAEHWKQSEFIAKLYKDFVSEPACLRATYMLDWDGRPINFGTADKPDSHIITYQLLTHALRVHDGTQFTIIEMAIRDNFDLFFVYIAQFERAIRNKLVQENEVYPYFLYWIDMLKGRRHLPSTLRDAINKYIDAYGFDDIKLFLDRPWTR